MTDEEAVLAAIARIVRANLNDSGLAITVGTRPEMVPAWNSLRMVDIILDIEDAFAMRFDVSDIDRLRTVGDMVDAVVARQSAR
ncbi:acyl carrier protein [Acidiphilium sp. PA]|uniref:acyl carrier protein n=1 Tax=Acidiphilium sp. PA TaxID=2871705 RepID=UPI002242CC2A|nr:acyl carrier protein [Acidiphilium sp. PA]MCW8306174.1 acyl carrier protein [Acidiphilium sp. PA]